MIEIYRMDESDDKRLRQTDDEHLWDDPGTEDYDDNELDFFGIVVRRRAASACPHKAFARNYPASLMLLKAHLTGTLG